MKKSILLDVDEVICFPGFLKACNDFLNTNYEIDDFDTYYLDEQIIPKDRWDEFISFLGKRNVYDDAVLLPDAFDVIKKLNDIYDIYICSSCINPFDINGSGCLFKNKYEYLVKELPFLDPTKFIFTNSKHLIKADIQIDDRLNNLDNDCFKLYLLKLKDVILYRYSSLYKTLLDIPTPMASILKDEKVF
jgi:5'(3')-deoxyribonucleotidase